MSSSSVSSVLSVSSCQVNSSNNNKDKGFQGGGSVSPYTWDSNSFHHNNINNNNNNNNNNNVHSINHNLSKSCMKKVRGILRESKQNFTTSTTTCKQNDNNTNSSSNMTRKGSVRFIGDPIVIGYCDESDSGNEEDDYDEVSSSSSSSFPFRREFRSSSGHQPNGDTSNDTSEEDSEFAELTRTNTRFNSNGANLKDSSNGLSHGQMNGKSINAISFKICDFKSECKRSEQLFPSSVSKRYNVFNSNSNNGNGNSSNGNGSSEKETKNGVNPSKLTMKSSLFFMSDDNSNAVSSSSSPTVVNGKGKFRPEWASSEIRSSSSSLLTPSSLSSSSSLSSLSPTTTPTTTTTTDDIVPTEGDGAEEKEDGEGDGDGDGEKLTSSQTIATLSPDPKFNQEIVRSAKDNPSSTKVSVNKISTDITNSIMKTPPSCFPQPILSSISSSASSSPSSIPLSSSSSSSSPPSSSPSSSSFPFSNAQTKLTPCITSKSVSSSNTVIEVPHDKGTLSSSLSSSSQKPPTSASYRQADSCTTTSHEKMKKEHETTFNSNHNNNADKKMGIKMFVPSSHLTSTSLSSSTSPSSSSSQSILSPSFVLNGEENNSTQAAGSTKTEKPLDEVQSERSSNNNNHNNNVKNSSCNGGSMQQVKLTHKSMYDQANESVTLIGYDHVDSEERVDKEWRKRAGRDVSLAEQHQQELNGCQDELGMNSVNKLPNSFEFGKSEHITTASAIITSRTVNLESENNGDTVSGGGEDGKKIPLTTTIHDELGSRSEEDASIINELSSVTKDDKVSSSPSSSSTSFPSPSTTTNTTSFTSKMETPCKPERCAKSSKPKIPSKPISLSSNFKKLTQSSESNSSATSSTSTSSINSPTDVINGDILDDKETHRPNHSKENSNLINAITDASPEFKVESKCTNKQQQIGNSSNRELRLAELAQELEKSRHWKGPAPPPPTNNAPSSGSSTASSRSSSSERPIKFNTISRAGTSSRGSGGSTKFSLKKLLKLSKDDHDIDNSNSGKPITSKIWKQKFEISPRHSSDLAHPDEISERQLVVGRDSKSASYETYAPRDRIYSLSSPSPPNGSQPLSALPPRTESSTKLSSATTSSSTGLQRPAVPARRSRQSDSSSAKGVTRPARPDHAPPKPRHSLGTPEDAKLMTTSVNFARSINAPSVSNVDGNLDFDQRKLSLDSSSSCGVMLSSLSVESAYSIMAKYNNETLSQILQNCFMTKKPIHTLPRENLKSLSQDQQFTCFTSSEIMFYRESSMQKIMLTGDADQSVNFMVS